MVTAGRIWSVVAGLLGLTALALAPCAWLDGAGMPAVTLGVSMLISASSLWRSARTIEEADAVLKR